MSKKKTFLYVLCAAVAVLTLCLGSFVRQNIASAADIPARRLQISPTQEDISLKPGDHYSSKYSVQNTGSETLKYKVTATPFGVKDQSYEQIFDEMGDHRQIAEWIRFDQTEGTIAPNQSINIHYTINVPQDVSAGGQYAALTIQIVEEGNQQQSATVKPVYRLAYLVYAEVDGNTRKTAEVNDNKINAFAFNPPLTASSIIKNTGNTHGKATDVLSVYSLFSNNPIYTNEDNPTTYTILPDTSRFSTISWDDAPAVGIFKVKHTVKLFDQESIVEAVVFICPLWLIILILIAIIAIIVLIVIKVRSSKKSKNLNKEV